MQILMPVLHYIMIQNLTEVLLYFVEGSLVFAGSQKMEYDQVPLSEGVKTIRDCWIYSEE